QKWYGPIAIPTRPRQATPECETPSEKRRGARCRQRRAPMRLRTKDASAADLVHRPFRAHEVVAADPVRRRLLPDAVADELRELVVARAASQELPSVPFGGREKTVSHLPLGRETEPVAGVAKRLRHGIDQPNS